MMNRIITRHVCRVISGKIEEFGETKDTIPPDLQGDIPRVPFDSAIFDFCADFSIINMLSLVRASASTLLV